MLFVVVCYLLLREVDSKEMTESRRDTSTSRLSPKLERYSADLDTAFDVGDTRVQHYGMLMKKPFGHKSARWQKR